jgi:DeoR/GlpR family transcriptional regulator of sugar metabolism
MNARERILNYIEEKGEPVSSKELYEELGVSKNTVYYNTTILVAAEKIKRYMGLAGVFILEKEAHK